MVLLSIEEKIVPVDIIRPLAQDENSSTIIVLGSTNNIDRALVGTGEIIARAYFDIRQGGALHLSLGANIIH